MVRALVRATAGGRGGGRGRGKGVKGADPADGEVIDVDNDPSSAAAGEAAAKAGHERKRKKLRKLGDERDKAQGPRNGEGAPSPE